MQLGGCVCTQLKTTPQNQSQRAFIRTVTHKSLPTLLHERPPNRKLQTFQVIIAPPPSELLNPSPHSTSKKTGAA